LAESQREARLKSSLDSVSPAPLFCERIWKAIAMGVCARCLFPIMGPALRGFAPAAAFPSWDNALQPKGGPALRGFAPAAFFPLWGQRYGGLRPLHLSHYGGQRYGGLHPLSRCDHWRIHRCNDAPTP